MTPTRKLTIGLWAASLAAMATVAAVAQTPAAAPAAAPKTAAPLPATRPLPAFQDHYATNDGVKIHYVSAGVASKPLVVLIHGYPDYWYTWRNLMAELAPDYRVVAMDTRGYNLSDKPVGVENYSQVHLAADVAAVIAAEGRKKATVVGHDWGASIAWNFALTKGDMVDRLVILSVPHPTNMQIALRDDPAQQRNSAYARRFQEPNSEATLTAESLAGWVRDPEAKPKYVEAFKRSSFAGMMNYYRANYPPLAAPGTPIAEVPKLKVPVLILSGVNDSALLPAGHNNSYLRSEKDTTVMWLPGVGHWIEQEAGPLANTAIHGWLTARPVTAASEK